MQGPWGDIIVIIRCKNRRGNITQRSHPTQKGRAENIKREDQFSQCETVLSQRSRREQNQTAKPDGQIQIEHKTFKNEREHNSVEK